MPILIDYSTISIGNAVNNLLKEIENQDPSLIDLIRHQVLNSIKSLNKKFRNEYGEVIISCDSHSKKYWRKEYFPYYKWKRKINNEKSNIDWNLVYSFVNTIKSELIEHFPYKVIEVPGAESDDIIAVLAKRLLADNQKVLICASDNDFVQLLDHKNIEQYSLRNKKLIKKPISIEEHLMEKCLKGDPGDGIPNILSEGNCFADGIRQKKCTQKLIDSVMTTNIIPEHLKANYDRNRILIDFNYIPENVKQSINDKYDNVEVNGSAGKLFHFFSEKRLNQHLDNIQDFV